MSQTVWKRIYLSSQSIRSKMSIRAEDRPKAFEAQFFSSSKKLSKYGDFDFKPGEIVRKRSSH